jgi:hypothetical protein
MKNLRKTKIISLVILANVLFVNFAFAQVIPPIQVDPDSANQFPGGNTQVDITSAELQAMAKKRDELIKRWDKSENITADLTAYKNQCKAIGDKLARATGTIINSSWNTQFNEQTFYCNWGIYRGTSTIPDSLGRNIKVEFNSQWQPEISRIAIMTGKDIYSTKSIYEAQVKAAQEANTQKQNANPISQVIGWILDIILNTIAAAILMLASIAGKLLDWSFYVTNTASGPTMVPRVWSIVRDLMNMVFILALIVISLGTILRLKEYSGNTGKLVLNLILMALLINFSKVIAETLILASDKVMGLFLANVHLKDIFSTLSLVVTNNQGLEGYFAGGTGGALARSFLPSFFFSHLFY